jgi:hypothetical protein
MSAAISREALVAHYSGDLADSPLKRYGPDMLSLSAQLPPQKLYAPTRSERRQG